MVPVHSKATANGYDGCDPIRPTSISSLKTATFRITLCYGSAYENSNKLREAFCSLHKHYDGPQKHFFRRREYFYGLENHFYGLEKYSDSLENHYSRLEEHYYGLKEYSDGLRESCYGPEKCLAGCR